MEQQNEIVPVDLLVSLDKVKVVMQTEPKPEVEDVQQKPSERYSSHPNIGQDDDEIEDEVEIEEEINI